MNSFPDTLKNTSDLRTFRFKAIYVNSEDSGAPVTAVTQTAFGVQQTKPDSGEAITVTVVGKTRMFAGGTIIFGNKLTVNASATFVSAGSGDTVYGIAKESVASGSHFKGWFYGGMAAETITQA